MTGAPVAVEPRPPVDVAFALAVDTFTDAVAHVPPEAWDGPDVGRATGREVSLPDALVAHAVHTAGSVPDEVLRRPDLFGPARPAPAGADDTVRLVAWLGRDVGGG